MFGERRKHQRAPINRVARIQSNSGGTCECTITDISDSGARLFVNDHELPPHFDLLISGDGFNRQECRVAWRNGGEVGVEFVSSERERGNLIAQVSEEARKVFGARTRDGNAVAFEK